MTRIRARAPIPPADIPELPQAWEIEVVPGPHAAPEFFTDDDLEVFYATAWEVHYNSARTGVRLLGPRPGWARSDGGDAGLHPSNIHDTPYSVGAVNFTGDLPILLGPDGPSLGGFVCPATVISTERWKLGQLRPGDTVRFVPQRSDFGATLSRGPGHDDLSGVLERRDEGSGTPVVTYRANGDDNLLVEYGAMELSISMRARVHVLSEQINAAGLEGIIDLTPGVRTLQVHFDPRVDLAAARARDRVGARGQRAAHRSVGGSEPGDPPTPVVGRPGHARGHGALRRRGA